MSGRCFWKTSDTRWKIRSETELARRKPLCIKEFRPRSQKNEKILYFLKKSVDNVAVSCYTINCSGSESAAPRSVGKIFIILQGAAETIGGIAQLGERLTGSQEVSGSIPLISTIGKARFDESQSELFPFLSIRQIDMSQTASFAFSPKQAFQEKRPFFMLEYQKIDYEIML